MQAPLTRYLRFSKAFELVRTLCTSHATIYGRSIGIHLLIEGSNQVA